MKKLFVMMLALCLLFGMSALAEDAPTLTGDGEAYTTVSYTTEACTEYTVTIPAELNLVANEATGLVKGTMTYSLDVSKINTNFQIMIKLTGGNNGGSGDERDYRFNLWRAGGSETELVQYRMNYGKTNDPGGLFMAYPGATLLNWIYGQETTSGVLTAYADSADFKTAGTYTDTLTFTVSGSVPE